jgi:hypothetical protein
MAFATVLWIPSNIEPVFWLVIFVIVAYLIAKKASAKYFLHGFCISLVNCVWIIIVHIIFADNYLLNHPQEAEMVTKMGMNSPRLIVDYWSYCRNNFGTNPRTFLVSRF